MADHDPAAPDLQPGSPVRLGAHWDGEGTNFALFSAHAERVELCLFDESGANETARITLPEYTDEVWHGYLPGRRTRDALRLSRARPVRSGPRPPLQPQQAPARPLCPRDRRRCRMVDRSFRLQGRRGREGPLIQRGGQRALHAQGARRRPRRRLDRRCLTRTFRGRKPSSTRPTSRASPSSTPLSPKSCAAPSRAWGTSRSSNTSRASASARSSCCRSTPSPTTISY